MAVRTLSDRVSTLSRTSGVDTRLITDLIKFYLFQERVHKGRCNNTLFPMFWYYECMYIEHGRPGGVDSLIRTAGKARGELLSEEAVLAEVRDNARMQIRPSGTQIYTFSLLSERTGDTMA